MSTNNKTTKNKVTREMAFDALREIDTLANGMDFIPKELWEQEPVLCSIDVIKRNQMEDPNYLDGFSPDYKPLMMSFVLSHPDFMSIEHKRKVLLYVGHDIYVPIDMYQSNDISKLDEIVASMSPQFCEQITSEMSRFGFKGEPILHSVLSRTVTWAREGEWHSHDGWSSNFTSISIEDSTKGIETTLLDQHSCYVASGSSKTSSSNLDIEISTCEDGTGDHVSFTPIKRLPNDYLKDSIRTISWRRSPLTQKKLSK